jgi:type II secretory pathway component PulL
MRAFEIHVNGKKLCVAGLAEGASLFSVTCTENKHGRGSVGLSMNGMLPTQETVSWQNRTLRMDDEVMLKIIESSKADKYNVLQKAPRDARHYEKKYVRRMAKEFGWTIQVSAKGKKV